MDTLYRIMPVGWSVLFPPVKTTVPNIQNMHENGVNHDDPDDHDDHDDPANHDDPGNHDNSANPDDYANHD